MFGRVTIGFLGSVASPWVFLGIPIILVIAGSAWNYGAQEISVYTAELSAQQLFQARSVEGLKCVIEAAQSEYDLKSVLPGANLEQLEFNKNYDIEHRGRHYAERIQGTVNNISYLEKELAQVKEEQNGCRLLAVLAVGFVGFVVVSIFRSM